MKGRGKSRNRVWGEKERNVRDVEKRRRWSKGGHHVHAAMTATRVTPTAPHDGNALSHSPRIPHHTTHHKPSILVRSPDNSGTRDEQVLPPRTPFGDTCALRGGVVEDTTTCHRPIPFRRHLTHIHNKNITPIHIRHFIPSSTTTRHDTPVSSPVRSSKLPDPSKRRN